jgi:ferredoxin
MAELYFHNGEHHEIEDGSPIEEACEEAGVPFACSGGICGTCIIEVLEGIENLSDPTQAELDFIGEKGVKTERMACQCRIKSGTVKIKF